MLVLLSQHLYDYDLLLQLLSVQQSLLHILNSGFLLSVLCFHIPVLLRHQPLFYVIIFRLALFSDEVRHFYKHIQHDLLPYMSLLLCLILHNYVLLPEYLLYENLHSGNMYMSLRLCLHMLVPVFLFLHDRGLTHLFLSELLILRCKQNSAFLLSGRLQYMLLLLQNR